MNHSVNYRSDIDGLRAFAVIAVIFFHFFPNSLKGGFIGVDIFFVISGFLISSILFKQFESNSFSLLNFYERRIKRIFPALLLVLIATLGIGGHVLFTAEYEQLGKHVVGGAAFISNLVLWSEAGYFDVASESKPLLHLWSLGIEEQFYIIWPLLLWSMYRLRKNPLTLLFLLAGISFALNVYMTNYDKTAAFYSPQTRFWELLIGAICAYYTLHPEYMHKLWCYRLLKQTVQMNDNKWKNCLSVVGFIILLVSVFATRDKFFPGFIALFPTLGALFLIVSSNDAWVNRTILSARPLVWIGLISYPLYLWHWPLLVFSQLAEGGALSIEIRIGLIALSMLLAWATYIFIEKPIRFGAYGRLKAILLTALMVIIGILGYALYQGHSFILLKSHLRSVVDDRTIIRSDSSIACTDIEYAYQKEDAWFCQFGEDKTADLFILGDSHTSHLTPAFQRYAERSGQTVLMTASSGCPPLLGIQSMRGTAWKEKHNCQALNERIFEYVVTHNIPNVLLTGRWTYYTGSITKPGEFNYISMDETQENTRDFSRESFIHGLNETVKRYTKAGVKVIVLADTPQQPNAPRDMIRKAAYQNVPLNHFAISNTEHQKNQSWVNAQLSSVTKDKAHFIDLTATLCDEAVCSLINENDSLYHDDDHLSQAGALFVYPTLHKALDQAIQ